MTSLRPRDAQVFGRPGTTPVRAQCEIIARKRAGEYVVISVAAPDIAERANPGQFVEVSVEGSGAFLRRPFSIYQTSSAGPAAGTVEFVVDPQGVGSRWLAERNAHDVLDIIGPLGTSFPIPSQRVPCLLVGTGHGVAPLLMLGERLIRTGLRVDMIVGAPTQDRLFNTIDAKRNSASVTFTTEDGSFGTPGRVHDVFADVVARTGAKVVYASGSSDMLREISELASEAGIACQIAIDEQMACGTGICWTCVVPIAMKDGSTRLKRSCIDGPVFNGARIDWEASRWDRPTPELEAESDPVARVNEDELWT